jgi:2,4-dienoyl-CoA reductase [(3E)-enoyl-CoA-producing], peroxisomal
MMIDTVGTFLLSKFTVQESMKNGGVILNISASLHYNGTILQSHAGTAKAGVDALTKHMAVELGPRNIRVIGISPGPIENTEGFERLSSGDGKNLVNLIPVQRVGQSKDIADTCIFMASDGAKFITGTTLLVDGGVNLTAPNFPFFSPTIANAYPTFGKSSL